MTRIIAGFIFSYLLGSIPNAYIFAKMIKGIDLRQHGSGNLGATNAFRTLGKGIGTTVLALDILKGLINLQLAFHSTCISVLRRSLSWLATTGQYSLTSKEAKGWRQAWAPS
jgi:acyl-phosphate glycerol 3-phosphate acyltransferase